MNIGGIGAPKPVSAGPSPTLLGGGREEGTTVLSDSEARDWGGWERVEYLVGILVRDQAGYGSARGYGGLPPGDMGGRDQRKGNERMSITNII